MDKIKFLKSTKFFLFACLLMFLASCQKEIKYERILLEKPTEDLIEYDSPSFPTNLLTDQKNLTLFQAAVASNKAMRDNFDKTIKDVANAGLKLTPEPLDNVTLKEIKVGGEAIHLRSLAYYWLYLKFTGANPSEYLPYIEKARDILLEWAKSNNTNSDQLPQETNYLGFFEAYSVIRNHIPPTDQSLIDDWLVKKANYYLSFPPRTNNWETIRLLFLYELGYIFSDSKYLSAAETTYQTLLDVNVLASGKSEDLIKRDAFAYHAYDLLFYGKIFRAKYLYEGKAAMTAMMNLKSSSNTTVGDMIDYWEPFVKDPANNVHLEFVNTEYAPDKTRSDYNKPYDPATSVYVMEDLILAFPHVKTFIQAVNPNNDQSNRRFYGFIYWNFNMD